MMMCPAHSCDAQSFRPTMSRLRDDQNAPRRVLLLGSPLGCRTLGSHSRYSNPQYNRSYRMVSLWSYVRSLAQTATDSAEVLFLCRVHHHPGCPLSARPLMTLDQRFLLSPVSLALPSRLIVQARPVLVATAQVELGKKLRWYCGYILSFALFIDPSKTGSVHDKHISRSRQVER